MWGVGVIAYLLVSGGQSPFWGGNRYRTMAKTLSCDYTMDLPNFQHISNNGKDFISKLLMLNPQVISMLNNKLRLTLWQALAAFQLRKQLNNLEFHKLTDKQTLSSVQLCILVYSHAWSCGVIGIQGLRDVIIQRFRESGIQRFGNLRIRGFRYLRIQGFRDFRIWGFRDSGIKGFRDFKLWDSKRF